jgi:hypothetical protein
MTGASSRRLPRPPLALVVGLAAVAAFGLALLVGWTTSPRHEELRKPTLLGQPPAVQRLKVLGSAAAFPNAPPKRRSVVVVRQPKPVAGVGATKLPPPAKLPPPPKLPPIAPTGKLIVGSG